MKIKLFVFITLLILLLGSSSGFYWSEYKANSTRSNYFGAIGNLTYPEISHFSKIDSFSDGRPQVVIGNINDDIYPEIVAASPKDNTLYVFDHNLSILWSFTERNDTNLQAEKTQAYKSISLLLSDIDKDGKKEILFSICDSKSSETLLHLFDGQGHEIWRKKVLGRIPPAGILVNDFNNDGKKEILVASKNIYIFDYKGEVLSLYQEIMDDEHGFSGVAFHRRILFAMIWHYPQNIGYSGSVLTDISFRPINSYMKLKCFYINKNLSFTNVWEKEMENSLNPATEKINNFYIDNNFTTVFITHQHGFIIINITNGKEIDEYRWGTSWNYAVIQNVNRSFWTAGTKIFMYDNGIKWEYDYIYLGALTVYDVDGDGRSEVIASGSKGKLLFFDAGTGKKEMEVKLEGFLSQHATPVLIHSDTDMDGKDEIIAVEANDPGFPGRIVIIDNGTPPKENKSISMEMLVLTGIGTIITASAVIWIWRKKRNERK